MENKKSLYAWYVLVLLVLVYGFNFMDRYFLVILMEPIKEDLGLSNSAMGLLTGFVFSIVYSVAGIPLAYVADRYGRKQLLFWSLAIWSSFTVLSGFARNFFMLATARMGTAVSEAGCSPAAHSLIADYFHERRRGTAYAIYGLGISFGIGVGLSLGGWANQHYGWQMAFFIGGAPGLLLALLFVLTVKEPKRAKRVQPDGSASEALSMRAALTIISKEKWFWSTALALGLLSFAASAFEMWTPTFLMRVHHFSSAQTGATSGLIEGGAGIIGTLFGGLMSDHLGLKDRRWYLWIPAITGIVMIPLMWGFLFANERSLFVYYVTTILCTSCYMAPIVAIVQSLMPVYVRAQASALLLLVLNMLGPGAGVFFAGVLTDIFTPEHGDTALRYALTTTSLVGLLGVLAALIAAMQVKKKLSTNGMNNDSGVEQHEGIEYN